MTAERNETLTVGDRPGLDIRCAAGAVTVVEGEPGHIQIRVVSRDPSAFIVERVGERVLVRQEDRRLGRWSHADILARVPAGTAVDVNGASAEVAVEGAIGKLGANLASGSLRAFSVGGDALVRTASGDVELGEVQGRLELTSASGDVRVGPVHGSARVSTASGDVRLARVDGAFTARTASGDIEIADFRGDDLTCTSMSGDVRVGLPAGRTVDLDLATLSGDVTHSFPEGGEGDRVAVKLAVKTVSGDIRLSAAH